MITRRGLFKGLAALVGVAVVKPFVPKKKEYMTYVLPDNLIMKLRQPGLSTMIIESTANGRDKWFRDRYIGNWVTFTTDGKLYYWPKQWEKEYKLDEG